MTDAVQRQKRLDSYTVEYIQVLSNLEKVKSKLEADLAKVTNKAERNHSVPDFDWGKIGTLVHINEMLEDLIIHI